MVTQIVKWGMIATLLGSLATCAEEPERRASASYYPVPSDMPGAFEIPPIPSRSGTSSNSDQPRFAQPLGQNAVETGSIGGSANPAVKCLAAIPESCRAFVGYSPYWPYRYYGLYHSFGVHLHDGHHDFGHYWGNHGGRDYGSAHRSGHSGGHH